MPIHSAPSPLASTTVRIKANSPFIGGMEYRVEDWWDRVSGGSWMDAVGNPAALGYAMRSAKSGLPLDNDVLYGKVGSLGYLVHVSEIEADSKQES